MNLMKKNTTHTIIIIEEASISLIVHNKTMRQEEDPIERPIKIIIKRKMIMDRIMCQGAGDSNIASIINSKKTNIMMIMSNSNNNMNNRGEAEGKEDKDAIIEDKLDIIVGTINKIRKNTMKMNSITKNQ